MMRIKKTIAIALSLALGACLLTGCDKDAGGIVEDYLSQDKEKPSVSQNNGDYTVTFDANGGTFGTSSTFTAATTGGKLSAGSVPQNPTYSGYTFDMWLDESGKVLSLATTYTANVTYKAQWTPIGDNGDDDDNNDQGNNDDDNNNNQDNNYDDNNYGNGDDNTDDNNYGYDDDDNGGEVTFVFSTGWEDSITDVRIHVWGDEAYTDWGADGDIGGDNMTDNYDGTYSYTVTVDERGDVQGIVIMFTQEGKSWYAKSTDCTYSFTAGNTYNITFSDWNNSIYGTIDWDTWAVIPFDIYVL